MTDNHLLLNRLTELMLLKNKHILELDILFEDDKIGDFVKSIQIDSPYQQLILEGVLTETLEEDKLMVSFTIEGYFHYVLGEVIEKMAESKKANFLKDLLQNNKLNGIREGVEQCLVRDVEKGELNRLIWLIDQGGKALDVCVYPLAKAFINIKGNLKTEQEKREAIQKQISEVFDELLEDYSDYDIEVLSLTIDQLEKAQLNQSVKVIYKQIHKRIQPKTLNEIKLFISSIEHLSKYKRLENLESLENHISEVKNKDSGRIYNLFGVQYSFIAEYDKAIEYYEKSLAIKLKVHGNQHPDTADTYNNLGMVWRAKGEYDKAIEYYEKSLEIDLKLRGDKHPETAIIYNNLGKVWKEKGGYDKAIEYYEKSLVIILKVHGDKHPRTGIIYNNLGSVWEAK